MAEPELDSDFLGADFSAAGFAEVLEEVDDSDLVAEPDELASDFPVSDFGALVEAELSDARESVR